MLKFEGVFWKNSGTKKLEVQYKIGKGLTTVIWVNYHPPGNGGKDHNVPVFGGENYETNAYLSAQVMKSGAFSQVKAIAARDWNHDESFVWKKLSKDTSKRKTFGPM